MHIKSNIRGFTLVEVVIAVALTSVVLSGVYYLLNFTMRSYHFTDAKFVAEQDARHAVTSMEEDIRQARGIAEHNAVELSDSGMTATVYTDTTGDGTPEVVQYKLDKDQLKRGEAALGKTPTKWTVIATRVYNKLQSPKVEIFSISGKQVSINLVLADGADRLEEEPVLVSTSVAVRSKGAME